jgi:hypothetical protein
MGAIAAEAVPEEEQQELFSFMGQQEDIHPKDPHWYLPLIGVDVARRGAATARRCCVTRSSAATAIAARVPGGDEPSPRAAPAGAATPAG